MSRSRSRAQEDVSSTSFQVAKYGSMGFLSVKLIWQIVFSILQYTDVIDNPCYDKKDSQFGDGGKIMVAGTLTFVIITLLICLACVIAEFVVIICEVFWAVVTFAVLQGVVAFMVLVYGLICFYFYAIQFVLDVLTTCSMIWYSVELYQAQNVNRGRIQDGGYVISVPGQQQPYQPQYQPQYQQQQVFQVEYQMQPNSGASTMPYNAQSGNIA